MLDGINEESLLILKDIDNKKGNLIDIAKWHGASLNQVNKLSRLSKLYKNCSLYLDCKLLEKLKSLGLKALVLNKLVDDPAGMIEILEIIDLNIKRDELEMLPKALEEKRKTIRAKEYQAKELLYKLEGKEKEVNNNIDKLKNLKKESDKALKEFADMSEVGKEFILEHLGLFEGRYILKARLDIDWQKSLKKKETVVYDNDKYVNYIVDIESFKKSVERRIKNKNYMYYDTTRKEEWSWNYPYNPEYKIGDKVIEDIATNIKVNKKELEKFNLEKKQIKKYIANLKKESSSNYMQQAIISNTLSSKELIYHTKLQNDGMRFLYNNGYAAVTEISKDSYRFDVIWFNENEDIIIIEAKASMSDFRQDHKIEMYKNYCNILYLIMDKIVYYKADSEINKRLRDIGVGLILIWNDKINIEIEPVINTVDDGIKKNLKFKIGRKLSEKYIYSLK